MSYITTTALKKILKLKKRLKIIQGGTAAGKTIAILLIFIDKAQRNKGRILSVISETMPHLKRGAVRDFLLIMETQGYYKDELWNKSELTYTFETGSKVEFFSADQPSKVRGPRRNDLFLNECNGINYETYTQLAIRTDGEIFLDYNPVSSFWVHEDILPKLEHDFLILTYKDNEGLSETIIKEIESRQNNKNFWKVYGEGLLGDVEGKIYRDWALIDSVPKEARLERYGLDFGYTNDPTAIVAIYYFNGGYILDEMLYLRGLPNKEIADSLKTYKPALIIADSAEPKSIDEIRSYGLNITGADKGQDSVRHGIQIVQDNIISVTKQSTNLIKEYRNYLWQTDKNGKILNEPEKGSDHALDAIRYALATLGKSVRQTDYWDRIWEDKLERSKEPLNLAR